MNTLHDNYKILTPMTPIDIDAAYAACGFMHYGDENVPAKANLRHAVDGLAYIKYLKAFEFEKPMSRKEADAKAHFGLGSDNWKRLLSWNVLEVDHIGKYHCSFWKLTDDGYEVLSMVEANRPYYRVMRWYDTTLDDDSLMVKLMDADLKGEDASSALEPNGIVEMLNAIFNPTSKCRLAGSSYRWVNKVMQTLKTRRDFLEKMSCPEVMAWLDEHIEYDGVSNFIKLLNMLLKKNGMLKAA